jgi:hypothetical protein
MKSPCKTLIAYESGFAIYESHMFTDYCLQVQQLQQRILEIEQTNSTELERKNSQANTSLGSSAFVSEQTAQQEALEPKFAQEANAASEALGGAWIIGHSRHAALKGRAMRDVGVQVHFSLPSTSTLRPQGHVQMQTDAPDTRNRSSSPMPAVPPSKTDVDDGKPECVQCITPLACHMFGLAHSIKRAQSARVCLLHEDVLGLRVSHPCIGSPCDIALTLLQSPPQAGSRSCCYATA